MKAIDRLKKSIRGVDRDKPVTQLQLSEIIRRLWSDQGKIINIINNEIVNNTTNIYQSISQIIGAKQADNHYVAQIENTINTSETVVSPWSVLPYNQQMGEFKAVVAVRNKTTNTIVTLISLLSFDYSDTVPAFIQNNLLTDDAISLILGVGKNKLYARVENMPEDAKRIHFCMERCVLSERAFEVSADFDFNFDMNAKPLAYTDISADFELELDVDAKILANKEISAGFGFELNVSAELIDSGSVSENLILTWDNIANVPVTNPANISDWNSFFELPTKGNPFTSVVVSGNEVRLIGGSDIILKTNLFANNHKLISIIDSGSIIAAQDSVFIGTLNLFNIDLPRIASAGNLCFAGNLSNEIRLPSLLSAGNQCFNGCYNTTVFDFPLLENIGDECFYTCYSVLTLNLRNCLNLGTSVNYNFMFFYISGQTITLTIPAVLMTCNGGNPDGDIQYLQANNSVTIITV